MKKLPMKMTPLFLVTQCLMADSTSLIMLDDITVVIPLKTCKKRPQIQGGTYVERFYNLPNLNIGDSWYWDGCNWQKTQKDCQFEKVDGEIQAQTIMPSSLKDHHTLTTDSVEGEVIIGCSLDSNYDLGEGFNEYNDFKLLLVYDDNIIGYAFASYNGQDDLWWLRTTDAEVITKEKYPYSW